MYMYMYTGGTLGVCRSVRAMDPSLGVMTQGHRNLMLSRRNQMYSVWINSKEDSCTGTGFDIE